MNKNTAREFIEALAWFEAPFGKIDLLLSQLEDEEKEFYIEKLGDFLHTHASIMI